MLRVFVDCDGTLVIYESGTFQPYGVLKGEQYELNDDLIESLIQVRDFHPDALMVCWSGGGQDYAEEIAKLCGIEHLFDLFMFKDRPNFYLATEGSIVIDDMAESVMIPQIDKIWLPDDFGWKAKVDERSSTNGSDTVRQ